MLRLRKILLLDYLYYLLFFIVLVIAFIRNSLPVKSNYTVNSTKLTGIVTDKKYKDEKITLEVKDKNKEKLLVTFYSKRDTKINLGDKVAVKGIFIEPSTNTTKYLFNYKKYLQRKNIYFIVEKDEIKLIKHNRNLYYMVKKTIIKYLDNNPYLNTFLLGDKNYLNDEATRSFQSNGISHLFAISGMHITLLSSIIEKLLRKHFSTETTFKITSIILLIYLLLVGLSPSILRGVLFYILFKINNIYYFYIKAVNLFLFIISISLLINPSYIFDVGFQYSYLISLSLIVLSDKLKSENYLLGLFKVSIISSIVSIPISLYNFYEINILSIIYNLFFVPLVSLVIFPSSIVAGIISPIRPIYDLLTNILETSSIFISKITLGRLIFKRLPLIIYLIYFLIILIYLLKKNNKILLILLSCLIIHYLIPYFDKTDYLKVIDIGQGDSLLLHTQGKNILIDTGGVLSISKNNGGKLFYQTISPLLKSSGIKKLDYLIISHGDFDHMGEAPILINNFKVKKVIFNKNEYNDLEKNLITLLKKKNISYYKNVKEINLNSAKLYFLNTGLYNNENDNSNVIYTSINGNKLLLMGDAGVKVEENILNKYNIKNIDILKVGHHGSDTSTSKNFINVMNPKVSLISVGENNKFGHPKEKVLNTLKNTKIYRTDKDGTITIKLNNNGYKIEKSIP